MIAAVEALADIVAAAWDCVRHPVQYWRIWALDFALTGVVVFAAFVAYR
jgi:hypothetical protein